MKTESIASENINRFLNKCADEAHTTAKSKGFWNIEKSIDNQKTLLMLVVSELCEALEQDRKKKPKKARLTAFNSILENHKPSDEDFDAYYSFNFELFVKDTIEDELADVVIRLLDFARGYDITIDVYRFGVSPGMHNEKTFAAMLWHVSGIIHQFDFVMCGNYDSNFMRERVVNTAIVNVMHIAHKMNMELQMHIELKMQYNAYREQLNGKKY